jgi:YgiT-type zinc finger domain-containing protein
MESRISDLPFKVSATTIVVLRSLPVWECTQCHDTEFEHETLRNIEAILAKVDPGAELEVIRYAA